MSDNVVAPRRIAKNGFSWWVNNQEPAFWDRVESGDWEPLTYRVFDRFLDVGHSCLDVGAWIGPTTFYAASLARHCYALEPDPVAFARLRENVALNPDLTGRITVFPKCLASTSGPVRVGNRTSAGGGDSMSSLLFAASDVGWEVQGVDLESFLTQNSIRDCSFIKMDIEGGEFDILPTIADYLATRRPTLYLSLHPGFLPEPQSRLRAVREVLSCYRHVLTPDLHVVPLDCLCDPDTFRSCYELVFSDVDCA